MKTIREWLKNNPLKNYVVEQGLFIIGVNIYHIFSLLWEKTTRKYTKEFLIYKAQETMELFISMLPEEVDIAVVVERVTEARQTIQKSCSTIESMIEILGAEVDNYPGNQYGLSADFKLAFILEGLNAIGISDEQIFEKYQN